MTLIVGEEDKGNQEVKVIMSDGKIKSIWKQPLLTLSILTRKGQMPSIHGNYIRISEFKMKAHFPIITKETWLTLDGEKICEGDKILDSSITPDGKMLYKIEGGPEWADIPPTPEEMTKATLTISFYNLKSKLYGKMLYKIEGGPEWADTTNTRRNDKSNPYNILLQFKKQAIMANTT